MPIRFDAIDEFVSALDEVDILIASAAACIKDERKYVVYNKAAVLLLAGKFETFAEALAEEYVFQVNSLNLNSNTIPDVLRLQHTFAALNHLETLKSRHKAGDALNVFSSLGELWGTAKTFTALKVNCKFVYGKHGEDELRKLFANIGVEDLFAAVIIYRFQDKEDPASSIQVDFKGIFNSVTGIRNNILHEDATPSLTHVLIDEHKTLFRYFAEKLAHHLSANLETLSSNRDSP